MQQFGGLWCCWWWCHEMTWYETSWERMTWDDMIWRAMREAELIWAGRSWTRAFVAIQVVLRPGGSGGARQEHGPAYEQTICSNLEAIVMMMMVMPWNDRIRDELREDDMRWHDMRWDASWAEMSWAELNKSICEHWDSMGEEKEMLEDFWEFLRTLQDPWEFWHIFAYFWSTWKTQEIQAPKKVLTSERRQKDAQKEQVDHSWYRQLREKAVQTKAGKMSKKKQKGNLDPPSR